MTKFLFTITSLLVLTAAHSQGNYVFSGSEIANSITVDMSTKTAQTWCTARGASPGYFSALNGGSFTGASDAVNINGYVKEYNSSSFSFPIGSGTQLHQLVITGAPAANTIAASWIAGDPTITADPTDNFSSQMHPVTMISGDIMLVSDKGQWDWQDINGNAAGTKVTVSVPDLSAVNPAPLASSLRLAGWNGTQWINLSVAEGANAATGISASSTVTGTMQANITAIAVGFVSLPAVSIRITPNPATDNLQIYNAAAGSKFEVVDMLGQVVLPYTTYKIINVSSLAKGQYVLKALDQNGQLKTYKFIKQ